VPAQDVDAGVYTLSEVGVSGYTASDWTCTNGVTVNGDDEITLDVGESTICSITNDDEPATLTLDKIVINDDDGEALETDFTLSADGPNDISGPGGVGPVEVSAGVYVLSETGPDGYTPSDWVCDGGDLDGNVLTLAVGESAVCTMTNDDFDPGSSIGVEKRSNGLPPNREFDFRLTGGPDDVDITLTTREDDVPLNSGNLDFGELPAGDYVLCELNVPLGTISTLIFEDGATFDIFTRNVCAPITLEEGEQLIIEVNNLTPVFGGGGGGTPTPTPTPPAPPTPSTPPPPTVVLDARSPLPKTGAGQLVTEAAAALALIVIGFGLRRLRRPKGKLG
jgi:hypothetical protein